MCVGACRLVPRIGHDRRTSIRSGPTSNLPAPGGLSPRCRYKGTPGDGPMMSMLTAHAQFFVEGEGAGIGELNVRVAPRARQLRIELGGPVGADRGLLF